MINFYSKSQTGEKHQKQNINFCEVSFLDKTFSLLDLLDLLEDPFLVPGLYTFSKANFEFIKLTLTQK